MVLSRHKVVVCGGVNGRNRDNTPIQARLGWEPQLKDGLRKTYDWIESQVEALSCV